MHAACPTTFLPSNVVLVSGLILAAWGLGESIPPLLAHPAHNRLPLRLVVGCLILAADAFAAYLLAHGLFLAGIGVGTFAGVVALLAAGRLERFLLADEKLTAPERDAAIKRAGKLSHLVRAFAVAVLSIVVAAGALPLSR